MFKNMSLVILFDMFLNLSFKMTTSFANIARTRASTCASIIFYRSDSTICYIKKNIYIC